MRHFQSFQIPIALVVAGWLLFSFTPTAHDFASLEHQLGGRKFVLIDTVHKAHWVIAYRYGEDCPEAERNNGKQLEAAITTALRAWLLPLKGLGTKTPIVDEFRYELHADAKKEVHGGGDLAARERVDLRVSFYCDKGESSAWIAEKPPWSPDVHMHEGGTNVDRNLMSVLTHELGHAMGMGDTYTGRPGLQPSATTGGLDETAGTQPPSLMSSHHRPGAPRHISEDDENGIVWLYKFSHEGLARDDCFFPNYRFEKRPDGCVPKYPIIFEMEHGRNRFALQILNEDENINVNARDESGSTALHYAVLKGYTGVVKALLSREDIWVSPRNKAGDTPIELARERGDKDTVKLLSKHPNRHLSVAPKGKLATTWGRVKRGD